MKKKILLISASAGSGHVRAADALLQTANQYYPDSIDATHIDMMDYVTLPVKTAIKSYDMLVKQMPELWGFLYKQSNSPKHIKQFQKLTKLINRMNAARLYQYVTDVQPDSIICTHLDRKSVV